ncbi:MAG: metal-dependent hydrolase [Candidatus Micrarchaeota archaeon]
MNWSAHLLIGVAVGCLLAFLLGLGWQAALIPIALAAFSALVPDIDHGESKIRQFSDLAAIAFAVFFAVAAKCPAFACTLSSWQDTAVYALAIFGAYAIVMTYVMPRHRGIIHSILFAVIYAVLLLLLSNLQFALFGLAGYLSHLLADREIKLL